MTYTSFDRGLGISGTEQRQNAWANFFSIPKLISKPEKKQKQVNSGNINYNTNVAISCEFEDEVVRISGKVVRLFEKTEYSLKSSHEIDFRDAISFWSDELSSLEADRKLIEKEIEYVSQIDRAYTRKHITSLKQRLAIINKKIVFVKTVSIRLTKIYNSIKAEQSFRIHIKELGKHIRNEINDLIEEDEEDFIKPTEYAIEKAAELTSELALICPHYFKAWASTEGSGYIRLTWFKPESDKKLSLVIPPKLSPNLKMYLRCNWNDEPKNDYDVSAEKVSDLLALMAL